MNYNEMTSAQCADWLAEKDGWLWRPYAGDEHWRLWTLAAKNAEQFDHPYQLTLDAAAGALREPWVIHRICWHTAHVSVSMWRRNSACWKNVHGPDELTARYRAAVAARMEEEQ